MIDKYFGNSRVRVEKLHRIDQVKVLVTGATGFIGRHVVSRLINGGHKIVATSTLAKKAMRFEWFNQVEYIEHNFDQFQENYFDFFQQPNKMIHLAWEGLPNYSSMVHVTKNLPAQIDFLHNIAKNGLTDFTVLGTCLEYGLQEGELDEEMCAEPINNYGVAKDTLRRICLNSADEWRCKIKWLRLFYTYGDGQSDRALFSQLEKAIGDGKHTFNMSEGDQQRDYLPVTRVADLIVRIALQSEHDGIVNVCSGRAQTVKILVKQYLKERNANIALNLGVYDYPAFEPMAFWGSVKKLNCIVGEKE